MNSNQLEQVKSKLEEFENYDFEKKILEYLKESQSMIGIYSPEEFVATLKRVLKQLKRELADKNDFNYLPLQYNFGNEFGNGNLLHDLQNLKAHIDSNQFPNTIGYLKRLIYYQVVNGFWDKSKRKFHKSDEIKLTEANDRIEYLEKKLKGIIARLEEDRTEFDEYFQSKKDDLIEVDRNLESARLSVTQINTLLTESNENKNEIEEDKNLVRNEKELIESARLEIEKFNKTIKVKISEFEEKDSSFKERLEFVESKKEYFEERLQYLEELIGREVGASLFETFKQRKLELNFSVNFWKFAVPTMTIAIIIWIYCLFNISETNVDETTKVIRNINWEEYVVNTLKLIPAIILLFFTIRQYKKEREFQEEYAFKSAVALTIDAYSKKISSPEKKDDMIMNSVHSIYRTPIKTKRTRENVKTKSMLEGIEAVKDTVIEIAKGIK